MCRLCVLCELLCDQSSTNVDARRDLVCLYVYRSGTFEAFLTRDETFQTSCTEEARAFFLFFHFFSHSHRHFFLFFRSFAPLFSFFFSVSFPCAKEKQLTGDDTYFPQRGKNKRQPNGPKKEVGRRSTIENRPTISRSSGSPRVVAYQSSTKI